MILALFALVGGIALLVWSADRFVEGSACAARYWGMPPLVIGMVVVGFGTSAPELVVSAFAALQNTPGIALGNAYGSNITNIGLILGITALINPVLVHSRVLRKELPILVFVSLFAAGQLMDGMISQRDAVVLLVLFAGLTFWSLAQGLTKTHDALEQEMEQALRVLPLTLRRACFWMVAGLVVLIVSSRILVWGAVDIAHRLGVSDLLIGLTIVAVGTSLPELASSIIASRKGEHDIALGNVLGSNLFNTLAVVGVAGVIHPMVVPREIIVRDISVMLVMTLSLFALGYGFRAPGRITRSEGAVLLLSFIGYTVYLVVTCV